jgi:hypothetical protein
MLLRYLFSTLEVRLEAVHVAMIGLICKDNHTHVLDEGIGIIIASHTVDDRTAVPYICSYFALR